MNSSSPKVINLHSAHDGSVVLLSFRVVGHGGAVFNIIVFVNYVEEIRRQICGTSSKRSRSRLGIMAIRKHRLGKSRFSGGAAAVSGASVEEKDEKTKSKTKASGRCGLMM